MPTKRHTSAEKFTQFLVGNNWHTDPRLRANMQKLIKKHPDRHEESWFDYFLKQFQDEVSSLLQKNLAQQHLQAYLEEVCSWCARRVKSKLEGFFPHITVDYCLQEARVIAYKNKFWQKYNSSFKKPLAYAYRKIELSLREKIFADHKDRPSSDYGLLVRTSKKSMSEALQGDGFGEQQLSQHLLVWQVVKNIAADLPRNGNGVRAVIKEPTSEQFTEICRQCQDLGAKTMNLLQVQEIISHCIKALKSRKKIVETPLPPGELPETEIHDYDSDELLSSPENSRILGILLGGSIASVDSLIKNLPRGITEKLLLLSYGVAGVNQAVIGKELGIPQYQVSRLLTKAKTCLIKELVILSKQHPKIKLDIDYIDSLGDEMDILLTWYYRQQVISKELENALRSHSSLRNGINVLQAYFGHLPHECAKKLQDIDLQPKELDKKIVRVREKLNLQKEEIAKKLQTTAEKVLEQVDHLVAEIVEYLSDYFRNKLSLSVEIISKIKECLHRNVYVFLCTVPYSSLFIEG